MTPARTVQGRMDDVESAPVLELSNVTKRYGNAAAVSGLSLTLRPGEVMALLGPSGCGKTTTLRMVAGFTDPDSGTIRIAGKNMQGVRPYERNIGLVFQDYALFPHLTVADNIGYGLRQRRFPRRDIPDRVSEMLKMVRLDGYGSRRPVGLSGGQQQRVALARALATDPKLVLLDEPLSALDAKLRQELQWELKELLSASHATAIIVTHDQEEAMSLAGHVVLLGNGAILQSGAPLDLYRRPCSIEVAKFIGRSNWLEGVLGPIDADGLACFAFRDGCVRVAVQSGTLEGAGWLCIRPETLRIASAPSDQPTIEGLRGRIVGLTHLGADTQVVVELGSGTRFLVVEDGKAGEDRRSGQVVVLAFNPDDGRFFRTF